MQSAESAAEVGFHNPAQRAWGFVASVLIFIYTIVCGLLCILLLLVTRKGWPADFIGRIWCRLIVKTCGIEIDTRGLENIDPRGRYVLISNHLSNFDIWCTFAVMPVKIRFVAKRELLKIPVFGWALGLSDHIVIDRSKPEQAVAIINRLAIERIDEGFCILFYGEGTRSKTGEVGPFKKGGVVLALSTGLPIVPVSVSGTRKFLPKHSVFIRPGGRVRLVIEKPIETKGISLDDRDALNERVRDIVIRNYDPEL